MNNNIETLLSVIKQYLEQHTIPCSEHGDSLLIDFRILLGHQVEFISGFAKEMGFQTKLMPCNDSKGFIIEFKKFIEVKLKGFESDQKNT
ncbi:hypothetical protein [Flagellimonas marina]|uniref:Uncharacterized protein n=1 Tax=Flagellimonas marina TaxID=1775168 RepID=A0ABV8PJD0_9FLAO